MTTQLALSLTAITLSLASFGYTVFSNRRQRRNAATSTVYTGLASVESRIGEYANLLRFHGFEDPEGELNSCGLTASEFSYLVNSFTLGGSYFITSSNAAKAKALRPGSYRYQICAAIPTRRAWPLLKRMLSETPYRERLDDIFQELDRDHPLPANPSKLP